MDPNLFVASEYGKAFKTAGEHGYWAYRPAPLPRRLELPLTTVNLAVDAATAVGRLGGAGRLIPNPHLLIQPYLTREALASSRIEGTEASMSDVFDAQANLTSEGPVREVTNYIAAFHHGLEPLGSVPVSRRLLCEVHNVLLDGARGQEKLPGQVRNTQNWIGGSDIKSARFVPPVVSDMEDLLTDFERFIHEETELPDLVELALIHYQFETIHPFLDGNGRLGRLLMAFLLVEREILPTPLLYLSAWFERHQSAYYDHLQAVRESGEMIEWIEFFLQGVAVMANEAVTQAEQLTDLQRDFRARLQGDRSRSIEVVDLIFENPVVTTSRIARVLGTTPQSALNYVNKLVDAQILTEVRGAPGRGKRWISFDVYSTLVPGELPSFGDPI